MRGPQHYTPTARSSVVELYVMVVTLMPCAWKPAYRWRSRGRVPRHVSAQSVYTAVIVAQCNTWSTSCSFLSTSWPRFTYQPPLSLIRSPSRYGILLCPLLGWASVSKQLSFLSPFVFCGFVGNAPLYDTWLIQHQTLAKYGVKLNINI